MTTITTLRHEQPTEETPRMKVDSHTHQALPIADEALWDGRGRAPVVWAVGAHGGAGASTLAQVLAPVGDAGARWPAHDEFGLCVVVCRSTRTGLDAAQSAVLQAQSGHAGSCEVLGVVIVADAPGKTPKSLRHRESVLEELTTVWRVPYLPGIRENDIEDLAVWQPTSDTDEVAGRGRKRAKKQPVTAAVPQVLADRGDDIFRAAFAAHSDKETK